MASDAHLTLDNIERGVDGKVSVVSIEQMIVAGVNGDGTITLKSVLGSQAGAKAYARLVGNPVAADDYVVALRDSRGNYLVLGTFYDPSGAVLYLPLTGGTLTGFTSVKVNNGLANAFDIRDQNNRITLHVSTGYHEISALNGARISGYDGNYGTKTFGMDASTGAADFKAITGTSFNSPLAFAASDSWIQGSQISHSSNASYEDAVTVSVVLGTGTWSVLVWGAVVGMIAGSFDFRARAELGSSNGTANTSDIASDDYTTIFCRGLFTGQTGTLTAAVSYQPVTNGNNVVVGAAAVNALAWRTS